VKKPVESALNLLASPFSRSHPMHQLQSKEKLSWKQAPFIRLLFPLIGGILIENYLPMNASFQLPVFIFTVLLLFLCNLISLSGFFGFEWIAGLAIQLAFFSFGRILMTIHQDKSIEQSACYVKNQPNLLILRLQGEPVSKQKNFKCLATVSWLYKYQTCYVEKEKIIVFFSNKINPENIVAGSCIAVRKILLPIENFKAYPDFDYIRYCHLRHIDAQVFIKENEYVVLGKEKEKSLFDPLNSLRKKLQIIIKNRIPTKSENGLLEALMVGFTEDLDPGLLKSYADSGVIHIIAISGLHLALIYHILQLLLKKIPQKKQIRWFKLFLIIGLLWGYSILSGASPSVIRSALMFSLVLFSRNVSREAVLYNTLAASAFLLLCFDPYWIWDTGFQLSYAAVLSLRLFSKPIRDLLPVQNKFLLMIWEAGSVSLAAQLLTTPISIYYFHRFPSYFLIANLIAVPLSSAILVGGILLCIFSFIDPLGQLLGWGLAYLIRSMNDFIIYISHLPGAVWSQLRLSLPEMLVAYLIIFSFYIFLKNRKIAWLLTGLGSICLFQLIRWIA